MEVLKSLAKAGSRREKSDSLHYKGCNMYPMQTIHKDLLLGRQALWLCWSWIYASPSSPIETPNPGQLWAFSEIQLLLIRLLSNYLFHCTLQNTRETFFRLRRKPNGKRSRWGQCILVSFITERKKTFSFPHWIKWAAVVRFLPNIAAWIGKVLDYWSHFSCFTPNWNMKDSHRRQQHLALICSPA